MQKLGLECCHTCGSSKTKRIVLPCHHVACLRCAADTFFKPFEKNDLKRGKSVAINLKRRLLSCIICSLTIQISPSELEQLQKTVKEKCQKEIGMSSDRNSSVGKNTTSLKRKQSDQMKLSLLSPAKHKIKAMISDSQQSYTNYYATPVYSPTNSPYNIEEAMRRLKMTSQSRSRKNSQCKHRLRGEDRQEYQSPYIRTDRPLSREREEQMDIKFQSLKIFPNQDGHHILSANIGSSRQILANTVIPQNLSHSNLAMSLTDKFFKCDDAQSVSSETTQKREAIHNQLSTQALSNQGSSRDLKDTVLPLRNKQSVSLKQHIKCLSHPTEDLIYYCFSCKVLICTQCTFYGAHQGHVIHTLKKTIRIFNDELETHIKLVDKVLQESASIQRNLHSADQKFKNRMKQQKSKLKNIFEEFMAKVQQKYIQLLTLLQEKEQKVLQQHEQDISVQVKKTQQYEKIRNDIACLFHLEDSLLSSLACESGQKRKALGNEKLDFLSLSLLNETIPKNCPQSDDCSDAWAKIGSLHFQKILREFKNIQQQVQPLLKLQQGQKAPRQSTQTKQVIEKNIKPQLSNISRKKQDSILISSSRINDSDNGLFSLTPSFVKDSSNYQTEVIENGKLLSNILKSDHEDQLSIELKWWMDGQSVQLPELSRTMSTLKELGDTIKRMEIKFTRYDL